MGPDTCECGQPKDPRAKKCRNCWAGRTAPPQTKVCTGRCARVLPIETFQMRRDKWGKDVKRRARCPECEAADGRELQAAKRASQTPEERRARKLREAASLNADPQRKLRRSIMTCARGLGLDADVVWAAWLVNGNRCQACGHEPGPGENRVSIDHCHDTGAFRGFLCNGCNFAVGLVENDVQRLLALARYLIGPVCGGRI